MQFRCANCPNKTKCIGGRGPFDSPFVIVGESPGATELATGKPFMGPSGQMLNDVLKEAGFADLGVDPYITNALSCYPGRDKSISSMQHATSCCQSRLREELEAHPRDVILCLGAAATWSVTGDYSLRITRDRGKILESALARRGIVLAVHPAYLMRFGGGLPFWKRDLKSAIELFKGNVDVKWRAPEWLILETRQELEEVINEYTSVEGTLVTGDYETDSLQALFGRALSLGFTKGSGNLVHIIPEELYYDNLDLITTILEHPNIRWNWHNGKFDIQWAWAHNTNARVDEDTMMISYALNENRGFHDLDQTAQCWLGAPAHKGAMSKYYKMAPHYSLRNAPKDELYRYQAFDISKTHKQWTPMMEALQEDPRLVNLYYKTLIPASHFFARIERHGVRVNKEKVAENLKKEDALLEAIRARLNVYARLHLGEDINWNSPQQIRPLLYKHLQLGLPGENAQWRNAEVCTTNEDRIIEMQRRNHHPVLHDLLEHREVVKRRGTYEQNLIDHYKTVANSKKPKFVKGLICPDGRIHGSFLIHGTTTGRPACRDPNLLNQPREGGIREQYEADEGKGFLEVDLNQAELRCLAVLSGDPTLIEIYTENKISIHDVTTAAFFASEEDMADEAVRNRCADLMQYFGERSVEKVYHEAKMAAKTVNFGIVYGREAHSIAQVFNVPHDEAQRWIEAWFDRYPKAAEYITKCRKSVIRNQTMVTPFGRKKRVGVVTPDTLKALENEAANFPHQSIAHDITLAAAMECEKFVNDHSGHYWNEVYDAVYVEVDCDDRKINAIVDRLTSVITRIPRDIGLTRIPFIGEAKFGYNWGEMKKWKGSIEETLQTGHRRAA